MKKAANHINFEQVMSLNPLVLRTIRNFMGQRILLVENPVHGDEYPVIAVCPDYLVCTEEDCVWGVAQNTTFFDTDDMYRGSDYEPLFVNGELKYRFEVLK